MKFVLAALLLVCAHAMAGERESLLVFAAASTSDAVSEVTAAFEAKHPGVKVVCSFAGTNELVRQIKAGATADVVLAAEDAALKGLGASRLNEQLLSNTLVVVVPAASKRRELHPKELQALDRIAIADPLSVPAGKYAKAWLVQQGLWRDLEKRLIPALDVRAALAAAEAGRVDAAIVYATDAARSKKVREVWRVPREEGPRIAYALGQRRGSKEAAALYDFFESEQAAEIFRRHGFLTTTK